MKGATGDEVHICGGGGGCVDDVLRQPVSSTTEEIRRAREYEPAKKKKLEFSQNVLAGLTEGDFEKISNNAKMLNVVSYLGKGTHADLEEYQRQLTYFDMANQELIRNAKKKNIDGATLWYNLLTTSCVQCHTIVRGAKK